MKLRTKRLILRPLEHSDAKDIVEGASDLRIAKWLLRVPYPYKLKDARAWIKEEYKK